MILRIFKIIGWMVAAIFGCVVALYLAAVIINLRDREPSATVVRFANLYRQRPPVGDQENAFIYVMGFAVAPAQSPSEMGRQRVAWMRESSRAGRFELAKDPLRERLDYKTIRLSAVRKFVEACKVGSADCAAAFAAGDEVFGQWMDSESWLLERYKTLIAHPGWREDVPSDLTAPLPAYALVMDGQRVLLLNAKIMAERGDFIGVRKSLEEDLRFWRMVLESSDMLITKMIATAAINRHFEIGSLIFREIRSGNVMDAAPSNWSVPISEAERSMRRCLVGEWIFMSGALRNVDAHLYALTDNSRVPRILGGLMAPLYQRQDSINRGAEYLSTTSELLSVPLDQYADAVNRTKEFAERTRKEALPPRSAYNIVGRFLEGEGASDFGAYARRVGDLEGVRRAAVAAVTLRAANVQAAGVAAALAASQLRGPYDNQPFEWDQKHSAIVFRGLELSERAEHRILY